MSFNVGLSGLRAATSNLNVSGNNIANASTTGFKGSRAEFGSLYAASQAGNLSIGNGVVLQQVAQQFTQGNISLTERDLDVAINGRGFFILNNGGERTYTRSGVFGVDKDGFIVSNTGGHLVGYAANTNGEIDLGHEADLHIDTFTMQPHKTSQVNMAFNLNATAPAVSLANYPIFDPADQNTFDYASSMTLYDSAGIPHIGTVYFRKDEPDPAIGTGANNDWFLWMVIDGAIVNKNPANDTSSPVDRDGDHSAFKVRFDELGRLDPATSRFVIDDWTPAQQIQDRFGSNAETLGPLGGAASPTYNGVVDENSSDFMLNIVGTTQLGDQFNVASNTQDGYGPGQLTGTDIAENGVLFARYTNGQTQILGQILLADFKNSQGLKPIDNTQWVETFESGQPIRGLASSGMFGTLQAGALEDSNVDIPEELVKLILAQRDYQANAKTIETNNATTQTILNLRN